MNSFLTFFSFSDPNVRLVVLGMILISSSAAVVGTFAFLQKKALVGDAVAHALLPGIAIAFMLSGSKNPWILIGGALISGWISLFLIEYLSHKTKLKSDASIALVLSVLFGLGILLLTHIQHSGVGNQSGLDKFLFGKAASITSDDLWAFGSVSILIIALTILFFKAFKLMSFNRDYAVTIGLPVKWLSFTLNTLLVLAIVAGIQAVGVVLMAALLIAPAAAARSWTNNLSTMIGISVVIGSLSAIVGSFISYTHANMPTGPWIVVALTFFTILSLLFAPQKGVLARVSQQKNNRKKILTENILKSFYHLTENREDPYVSFSPNDIKAKRSFTDQELQLGLKLLVKKLFLIPSDASFKLSQSGFEDAKRVVRLHRLWEMYLTQRLNMKSDHIHPNAETIEHIITPELEKELIKELGQPLTDPHKSVIPYPKS